MAGFSVTIIILAVVTVSIIIVYLAFPRIRGLHYTSKLTCAKCNKQFNYEWVPGGSFSAICLGTERTFAVQAVMNGQPLIYWLPVLSKIKRRLPKNLA
ncbi:MAG: hypothetical protein ABSA75_06615 [Candidatus Bathyarchaeia archaeon]